MSVGVCPMAVSDGLARRRGLKLRVTPDLQGELPKWSRALSSPAALRALPGGQQAPATPAAPSSPGRRRASTGSSSGPAPLQALPGYAAIASSASAAVEGPRPDGRPPALPSPAVRRRRLSPMRARGAAYQIQDESSAPPRSGSQVRFRLAQNTEHEVTPYSQVYGQHPRLFNFDREGRKKCVEAGTARAGARVSRFGSAYWPIDTASLLESPPISPRFGSAYWPIDNASLLESPPISPRKSPCSADDSPASPVQQHRNRLALAGVTSLLAQPLSPCSPELPLPPTPRSFTVAMAVGSSWW